MAPTFKACLIDGCNRSARSRDKGARGYCACHYTRLRIHGDPNAGGPIREARKRCCIETCSRPHYAKGFCNLHWRRNRLHGNPLAEKPSAKPMHPRAHWLQQHVAFSGDDCLIWPFCRSGNGYAYVMFMGKGTAAHRVMCFLAHGEPPTPKHEAAHSCGKGHEGCVNPRHLRWATRSQNNLDKVAHGTIVRGTDASSAKLTEESVREIRRLIPKMKNCLIAEKFGVSAATISEVKHGKVWGWVR